MVGKRCGLIVLVVLLVFGAAAEAGFQIGTRYLDERPFDPDTDFLDIYESLYLSIWTDEDVLGHMEVYAWALVCDWSLAAITGGEAGPDAEWGVSFSGSASALWDVPLSVPEDEDGQWGRIGGFELGPGVYLEKFVYTPEAVGNVTVRFVEINDSTGAILSVPDSIVIHQVPEPMTIGLFSLGGLLLVRRKQKKDGLKRKESNDGKR
jgi:hypothetical protein